ncbi:MAG: recombinase family protein [Clostridiales bacterium]|nr:recombinase family protein [Clostridiales bacterium]
MPTTTRTGAAYIRVSTHGKQEELSPDAQKRLIRDYAKKNHIYLPSDNIYVESGISGKYARKRPQFQRMIAAAKTTPRPFDVILVWKFSRFARNQEESIVYKSLLRNKCGVDVVSISEPVIDGMFGDLIERIIEWMDEFYSVRLAEDVKRGMTEKALRGGFQTAPPLGYAVPIKGQPPVIVPEEAKAIRRIFHAYADENMSMRHIAQELNQLGYKTKRGNKFDGRGIQYILDNPFYKGYVRWDGNTKDRRLASAEGGIIRKSSHPAIISEELWDKAHEKRLRDYVPAGAKVSLRKHWLSGIVKCPNCGRSLVYHNYFNRNGSRYEYFQCHGYNTGKCTTANGIPGKKLEREVVAALEETLKTNDLDYELLKNRRKPDDDTGLLEEQLKKLDQKEARIKEAYRNGIDTLEEYKENKSILQRERADLEKILKEKTAAADIDYSAVILANIRTAVDVLKDVSADNDKKAAAIRAVVEKIIYDKKTDSLSVYYYYS